MRKRSRHNRLSVSIFVAISYTHIHTCVGKEMYLRASYWHQLLSVLEIDGKPSL
jgi:hypothetical protein